jgi:hypothetical protein
MEAGKNETKVRQRPIITEGELQPRDDAPVPLEGLWLDDGRWKWEITKVGTGYKVCCLTKQHPGNSASLTFDGREAIITFNDNGYQGTLTWAPTRKAKGVRIFSGTPGDSPQVIGRRNPNTMEKIASAPSS